MVYDVVDFKGTSRGEDVVDKYEDCLFCTELDPFADYVHKLSNRQVSRDQVPVVKFCSSSFMGKGNGKRTRRMLGSPLVINLFRYRGNRSYHSLST